MEDALIDKLGQLMEGGDEKAARKFIIEHFDEFPADVQGELAVELFREAMQSDLSEREAIAKLKEEAIEAMEALDSLDDKKATN